MLQLLIETPEITLELARMIARDWFLTQTSNLRATDKSVDHFSAGRLLDRRRKCVMVVLSQSDNDHSNSQEPVCGCV
jgi:hypothetical protein